jgi:L-aspartate semialdehyde sulfurtransferase
MKTIEEINERIKNGDAVVVTAVEMTQIVRENGAEKAAEDIDVVTTGTFGAMCSSGAFLNFGHTDPPIKMTKTYLNGVEAYSGLAAVDTYIGATQPSRNPEIGIDYGGAHVIEDLIRGKDIELIASSYGTDCYPLTDLKTHVNIENLNEAIMVNPRNSYQNYAAAVNSTDETIYTYMGTLLPNMGNVSFSSAGGLSPLLNDPYFQTIGMGTKIFLCGAEGYVIGEGTQHNTEVQRKNGVPTDGAGTLMLKGDMKEMNHEYVRGATMPKYGSSLYVGAGIPIPILNSDIAQKTAISDEDIVCHVLDYGVAKRSKPTVLETNYKELRSGSIEINGVEIETSPLSSYKKALKIAEELKSWIDQGDFLLTNPVKLLVSEGRSPRPLEIRRQTVLVNEIKGKPLIIASPDDDITDVAKRLVQNNVNHLPVVDSDNKLLGIVTSWDIANAVAKGENRLKDVMTKKVVIAREDEPIDVIARRIDKHEISGLPIIDKNNRVKGMITAEDISRLMCVRNVEEGV